MMPCSGHPESCITIYRAQGARFTTYVQIRVPMFLMMPHYQMCGNKHNEDGACFLNSTRRLNQRQRTVRFPIGTETTKVQVRTALGSPKVLP